jgi:hypothetical protein
LPGRHKASDEKSPDDVEGSPEQLETAEADADIPQTNPEYDKFWELFVNHAFISLFFGSIWLVRGSEMASRY